MDLLTWTAFFALGSLFWSWILFWGGAEWLEGSLFSALLVSSRAPEWSAAGIRIFAAGAWLCELIWFLAGLFSPDVRPFGA